MSATPTGPIPRARSTAWIEEDWAGVEIHSVHHAPPATRTVEQALEHADQIANSLPHRVLPFEEDWDLVILADEVRRLQQLLQETYYVKEDFRIRKARSSSGNE